MENDKSLREIELEKVKEVIKDNFNDADCGCFSTRNWVGDAIVTIYSGTYFTVDICYNYGYFEIFGASPDEFKKLHDYYESLSIEEDEEDETHEQNFDDILEIIHAHHRIENMLCNDRKRFEKKEEANIPFKLCEKVKLKKDTNLGEFITYSPSLYSILGHAKVNCERIFTIRGFDLSDGTVLLDGCSQWLPARLFEKAIDVSIYPRGE